MSRNGDVTFQSASLRAGNNITVDAKRGSINFLSERASEFEQTETYNSNGVWWKSRDKGHYTETVIHNHLLAGGKITFKAKNGIYIEYREGEGNLDATIASLSRSPNLAWMAQLQGRNDVQWQAVKEAAEEWDHEAEGLTQAAAAVIAIAVTLATQGAASGFAGSLVASAGFTTVTAAGTTVLTTAGVALSNAIAAGLVSIASTASVSLINNKGDLGAVFAELGSSDFIKSLATSMLTAGLTAGFPSSIIPVGKGLDFAQKLQANVARGIISASLSTAIQGGDLGENLLNSLKSAAISTIGAEISTEIGIAYADANDGKSPDAVTYLVHKIAHGALGCAIGAASSGSGQGCAGGAVGAIASEVVGEIYFSKARADEFIDDVKRTIDPVTGQRVTEQQALVLLDKWKGWGLNIAKFSGALSAALVGSDPYIGLNTGSNAVENNLCGTGICLGLAALLIAALKTADVVLTGLDAIELGKAALACNNGDQQACNTVKSMVAVGGIAAGAGIAIKRIAPGGVAISELLDWARTKVDPSVLKQLDEVIEQACFVKGTPVWTPDGMKPIEQIKVGDMVLSKNETTNQTVFKRVKQTFVRKGRVLHVALRNADGEIESIGTTREHPFYVKGQGFVKAGELRPGMVIEQVAPSDVPSPLFTVRSKDNDSTGALLHRWLSQLGDWFGLGISVAQASDNSDQLTVVSLRLEEEKSTVYNFEVEDTHTYVVGKSQAWVHNACFETVTYKIKPGLTPLAGSRRTGVARAWKQEAALIRATGKGTRDWTPAELNHIRTKGPVPGYQGHHINDVQHFPNWAGDPRNIRFLSRPEHSAGLRGHRGRSTSELTSGRLIDRQASISQFNRIGQKPNLP